MLKLGSPRPDIRSRPARFMEKNVRVMRSIFPEFVTCFYAELLHSLIFICFNLIKNFTYNNFSNVF